MEEKLRAEETKNEMKNILRRLQDTLNELEATKTEKQKIIQDREQELQEEKRMNVAEGNALIQQAYKISDLRAENVSFSYISAVLLACITCGSPWMSLNEKYFVLHDKGFKVALMMKIMIMMTKLK